MPPEPEPELVLLPPDRHFVVPPLEEPVAFIEEVDEAYVVEEVLALVVFQRPPVVFEEPVAFIEEVDEADIVNQPLALVIFEPRVFMEDEPVDVDAPLVSSLRLYSSILS